MNIINDLSAVDCTFLFCAVVGGALFIIRSFLVIIGAGGDSDLADADLDIDTPGDTIGDSPYSALKMVSLHSVSAFLLMFGLVGFLATRRLGSPPAAGLLAAAAGLGTMYIIAKLFQSSRRLQSDGTIYPANAVGTTGTVYLSIAPGTIGKVQVTVRGALKVFDARAKDPAAAIKTGDSVRVTDAADVLIVEKI